MRPLRNVLRYPGALRPRFGTDGGAGLRRGRALAALAALAAMACSNNPFELTEASYNEHLALWRSSAIANYSFEYREVCECFPVLSMPNLVEVRNGRVWQVTLTDTGQLVNAETEALFPSVNDLFDRIDEAIRLEAATINISYHTTLGYPLEVTIDYDLTTVDDETTISVLNLETE